MKDAVYGLTQDFVFQDAVRFLKGKKAITSNEYAALDSESRARAFSVSGYTSLQMIQEFLDELHKASEEGTTMEAFRKTMNEFLVTHGYEADNPWHLDTIFRTNMQTAFNAGHYKSMTDATTKKLRPYWQYKTAGDGEVRKTHQDMADRVYTADDPIWDIWYPPNGFRCRCMVVSLSKEQVERRGLQVEHDPPYYVDYSTGEILYQFPDKGFSNNPAKTAFKPDMTQIDNKLKKAFEERENKPIKRFQEAGIRIEQGIYELDEKALGESLQAVVDILDDFGLPIKTINGLGITEKGIASANGFKDIGFNPKFYKKYNNDTGTTYTIGGTGYYSNAAHEMGHVVARTLTEEKMKGSNVLEIAKKWRSHTLQKEVVRETRKKYKGEEFVSEYGKTNASELLSEAFADVYLNGQSAGEYSKALVQTTKELFAKYK